MIAGGFHLIVSHEGIREMSRAFASSWKKESRSRRCRRSLRG